MTREQYRADVRAILEKIESSAIEAGYVAGQVGKPMPIAQAWCFDYIAMQLSRVKLDDD